MPAQIQQLKVFVASPHDCLVERSRLEKVVRELDSGLLARTAYRIELVAWETHVHPGFAEYPQSVVNGQIDSDYDIFIGILWARIGTRTPAHVSGTIEEFEIAYRKWQLQPSDVRLMIYFKDEPVAPSDLDPNQLAEVKKFKDQLPSSGGLYWTFRTSDDFETQVRLHLMGVVEEWRAKASTSTSEPSEFLYTTEIGLASDQTSVPSQKPIATHLDAMDNEELGFLDYVELSSAANEKLVAVAKRMRTAIEVVGKKTSDWTEQLNTPSAHSSTETARVVFAEIARNLDDFSEGLQHEIPQMVDAHSDLLKYLVGGATTSLDFYADGQDRIVEIVVEVDSLTDTLESVREQMRGMHSSIAGLPRMLVIFNRAKRRALKVLDELDAAFDVSIIKNVQVSSELSSLRRLRESTSDST